MKTLNPGSQNWFKLKLSDFKDESLMNDPVLFVVFCAFLFSCSQRQDMLIVGSPWKRDWDQERAASNTEHITSSPQWPLIWSSCNIAMTESRLSKVKKETCCVFSRTILIDMDGSWGQGKMQTAVLRDTAFTLNYAFNSGCWMVCHCSNELRDSSISYPLVKDGLVHLNGDEGGTEAPLLNI